MNLQLIAAFVCVLVCVRDKPGANHSSQDSGAEPGHRLSKQLIEPIALHCGTEAQGHGAATIQLGVLYVDGHFKPYYGEQPISQGYFSQRRLAHPGLMQYFVNDVEGRPVFFITEEAHKGLVGMLRPVVGEVRRLIGPEMAKSILKLIPKLDVPPSILSEQPPYGDLPGL